MARVTYNGVAVTAGGGSNVTVKTEQITNVVGTNWLGQLGLGDDVHYGVDVEQTVFSNNKKIKQIASSRFHTIFLYEDGTIRCAGENQYGQFCMNNDTDYGPAIQTPDISGVKQVAVGSEHTVLLFNNGTVWAAGGNQYGQVGIGEETGWETTVNVLPYSNVKEIACGTEHTVLLLDDGTLISFGNNGNGQLGMNNKNGVAGVIQTPTLSNIKHIAASWITTFVTLNDDTAKSFGYNNHGQLGNGDPSLGGNGEIQTLSFTNIKKIAPGHFHTGILFNDGTVKTFGLNEDGQLGMESSTNYNGAIQTPDISVGIVDIDSGSYHTILVPTGKKDILTFGYNGYGELALDLPLFDVSIYTTEYPFTRVINAGHFNSFIVQYKPV